MLFPYCRIPHAMDKAHEFIEFIFMEVWCKAPAIEYSLDLYLPNPSLHKIMDEIIRQDSAGKLKDGAAALKFLNGINEIFIEFKGLTAVEIDQYKSQFEQNNRIEQLCRNENGTTPAHYESLDPTKTVLNQKIKSFFKGLYSSGFFDLKCVKDEIGSTISNYYRDFVRRGNGNDKDVCPFCGIMPIDGEYAPTRDAFDHYLPKGTYPFNSVNLNNLCPSCNKCNSGNKLEQDPLHDSAGNRRKAFYPFGNDQPNISVSITLHESNWSSPSPDNVCVEVQSQQYPAETYTWAEIFHIQERYAEKCCSLNGGVDWRNRVLDECQNYQCTPNQMLAAEIKSADSSKWSGANFLKSAFLKGCQNAGLISEDEL